MATNHIVFIVLDSCRYDSLVAARTPNIDRIGKAEKRYSYASWTAPSHYAFTMGILPHVSPKDVFASEVYKDEFLQWKERTGSAEISFKDFLPEISLPKVLSKLGYYTVAKVSMPVLNKHTLISKHFDEYKLMDHHNDFAGMVEEIEFPADELHYYFLNVGETHYPYMLSGDDLPHISGVHGTLKAIAANDQDGAPHAHEPFAPAQLRMLHQQQVRCVEYIDGLIGKLMQRAPENTFYIVTSDHGELFGEGGYFGHGPIMHEKCFEIPFVEGMVKHARDNLSLLERRLTEPNHSRRLAGELQRSGSALSSFLHYPATVAVCYVSLWPEDGMFTGQWRKTKSAKNAVVAAAGHSIEK